MGIGNVKEAVRNYAVDLIANYGGRFRLPEKVENSFMFGCDQNLNTSPELEPNAASSLLTVIGTLQSIINLGNIDPDRGT